MFNWYDPDSNDCDGSWMLELPRTKQNKPNFKGSSRNSDQNLAPSTVLFVPNTNEGVLAKRLEKLEPQLTRLCGYRARIVEARGMPLSRLFSLDLSDDRSHRADCVVCLSHTGSGSAKGNL